MGMKRCVHGLDPETCIACIEWERDAAVVIDKPMADDDTTAGLPADFEEWAERFLFEVLHGPDTAHAATAAELAEVEADTFDYETVRNVMRDTFVYCMERHAQQHEFAKGFWGVVLDAGLHEIEKQKARADAAEQRLRETVSFEAGGIEVPTAPFTLNVTISAVDKLSAQHGIADFALAFQTGELSVAGAAGSTNYSWHYDTEHIRGKSPDDYRRQIADQRAAFEALVAKPDGEPH